MGSEFTGTAALSAHAAGAAGGTSQRASWNDNQKAHLLQVLYCFPRAHKGGWSKDVWEKITEYMNRKFPRSIFTTQQVKQQEKDLHKLYKQVKEILKRPGFRWDANNCTLEASNSCWIELSQSIGKFSWSRRRIPYYHRLVALYEGYEAEVKASQTVPLQSKSSSTQIQATRDEDDIASLSNSEEACFFFHGLVPNVPRPEFEAVPSLDSGAIPGPEFGIVPLQESGAINHRFQLNISPDQDFDMILSPSNPLSNLLTKKPNSQPAANYIKTQPSDLVKNSQQQITEKTSCLATVFPENPVPSILLNRMENHGYGDLIALSNQMSRNNPVTPSNIQAFSDLQDRPSCIEVPSLNNPQGSVSTINENGMRNTPGLSAWQLISTISSDKPPVFSASKGLLDNPDINRTTPPALMLRNFNSLKQSSPNNPPHRVSQQHGKQDSSSNNPEENPVRKIRGKQFRKKKIAEYSNYSMIRCMNMFNKLPGFEKSDIPHVIEIFRDELYRQAFIAMKKSHKVFWLKSTISKQK